MPADPVRRAWLDILLEEIEGPAAIVGENTIERVNSPFAKVAGEPADVWEGRRRQELPADLREIRQRQLPGGRTLHLYAAERETAPRADATLRYLIERLPHVVMIHRKNRILYLNPAARLLFGFEADEDIRGFPLVELVQPADRGPVAARVQHLYSGEPIPAAEERLVRVDGSELTVEMAGIPLEYEGELAALVLGQDLTERKEMEAQLVTADRLASIGRLAASVGHEINNPLAYVLGNVQLLRRQFDRFKGSYPEVPWAQLGDLLDIIDEGATRVRDIVQDLKTLSRGEDEEKVVSELEGVLGVCLDMAQHELRHRARVVTDFRGPPFVVGSRARLGQVFLNLIINAAQSIPEGDVEGNEVRLVTRHGAHGGAIVEVVDTGEGVPTEEVARIFEPFYTTKTAGSGTGLGLSICHHIVKSLGGSIDVANREERGSVFRVLLPSARGPELQEKERPVAQPRATAGSLRENARVLLVDDEEQVLHMLESQLDSFEVVSVATGRAALYRLRNDPPYDVILCDLMMGDLTGMDVYEHLKLWQPQLVDRLLFMTGGAYTQRARDLAGRTGVKLLEKPFSWEALEEAVDRVLCRSGRAESVAALKR